MSALSAFEAERKRLTGVAYRMLGRWSEAEDAVQDAYLRWQAADHGAIERPAAWLTTVVVRLCLDRMRRAKAAREVYVGPWLPEPILTMEGGERREDADMDSFADDLSLGLMVVLERLGPEERAAFILREAFDSSYAEIAAALGKNETAVRQLVSRARDRVRAERPRFRAEPEKHQRLLTEFLGAVAANDSGHIVSPDGIANQIEGGLIQSLSWSLKEEVKFDDTRVTSEDWASYPILTFSEVPPVDVVLIDRPGAPFLGTGEASQGPTGAALANAIFDATGVRFRRVPFTPERIRAGLAT